MKFSVIAMLVLALSLSGCDIATLPEKQDGPPKIIVVPPEDENIIIPDDDYYPLPPPAPSPFIQNPMLITSMSQLKAELAKPRGSSGRLLYAYAKWCGPCKIIEQNRVMEQVISKHPHIQIFKVDIDLVDLRNAELVPGHVINITRIPTVLFNKKELVGADQITFENISSLARK